MKVQVIVETVHGECRSNWKELLSEADFTIFQDDFKYKATHLKSLDSFSIESNTHIYYFNPDNIVSLHYQEQK